MGFGVSGEMKSTISQHLTPSTMNNTDTQGEWDDNKAKLDGVDDKDISRDNRLKILLHY